MFFVIRKRSISLLFTGLLFIGLSAGAYNLAMHPAMKDWVEEKLVINRVDTNSKIVALTFDDGPELKNTTAVLDVLKKHNVKATFFLMGSKAEKHPMLVKRMAAEGHEIGNHSYSHPDFNKKTIEDISDEITKTNEIIYKLTGQKPYLFRPPGGYLSYALVDYTKENNLTIAYWTYQQDSKDWRNGVKASRIAAHIVKHIQPGQIIILHDGCPNGMETAKAMDILIPKLHSEGYEFVTMTELIKSGNK